MTKYLIDESTLTALGDAVREKTGSSATLSLNEMIDSIKNISGENGGNNGVGSVDSVGYVVQNADSGGGFEFSPDPQWYNNAGMLVFVKSPTNKTGFATINNLGGNDYELTPSYIDIWGVDEFEGSSIYKYIL